MRSCIVFLAALFSVMACTSRKIQYPETRKVDTVDNYFGTLVRDPYRWLEDDRSPETEAWVDAENEVTSAYLSRIFYRDRIRDRITSLVDYPRMQTPWKDGDFYFLAKNDGLQDQDVYYVLKNTEAEPEVFVDPNTLSGEGTVALTGITVSEHSRFAAYSLARGGSDWQEIYVRDMKTGQDLDDHIMWVKFSGVAWRGDGFYYSRFETPGEGEELTEMNLGNKVYYHETGTSQEQDRMVYWKPRENDLAYVPVIFRGSHYLILSAFRTTSGNALYVADLTGENPEFREVVEGFDFNYFPVGMVGNELFLITNAHADRYKIVSIDLENPDAQWVNVIPEQEDRVITDAQVAGGKLVVQFQKDAQDLLAIYTLNGSFSTNIELPGPGTVNSLHGDPQDKFLFYSFESFTTPDIIFKYDMEQNIQETYYETRMDFDNSRFVTRQVFYKSKDGTEIPMFIVHRRDVEMNGQNPVWLYGYGGFNITLKPGFSSSRIVWFENGGIFAQANLRGGGEYGEEWHEAGMVLNKQNVFDDFIAAAEYLIDENYTSPGKLVIQGASNGGLLIGAVINQRPDLFRVAFPAVGVMDMLRFHKFTIGYYWTVDYGSSDDSVQFEYLYKYSPLHNIRSGVDYPAVLIQTADHDDRVVPAHSFKYAATLQEHYKGDNPVLIRIEKLAGHGSGKPISKTIEELADVYAFAFYNLGMKPDYGD